MTAISRLASAASRTPHPEEQYLDQLRLVWETGFERIDRTGVGTRSLFGATMRFSLEGDAVPLMTTKKVGWKTATKEMLWFLSGETNIRPLVEQGVHIWTDWPLDRYRRETSSQITRDEFEARVLEDDDFARKWGDLGPVYGAQWTHWPKYVPDAADGLYRRDPEGINQIANLLDGLRRNPASRRHIFTGWNVAEIDQMALPPCHMTYQFYVAGDRLSCALTQRSCDLGLGVPFNVYGASLLTRMIAQQCDLEAHELVWNGGDVHVYLNHEHLVRELLSRTPKGMPKLRIKRRPASIFEYRLEDFEVYDYEPQSHISAPVAV